MKRLTVIILLAWLVNPCVTSQEDRSITEIWKEVLLYGIDSEILKVIANIKDAAEESLHPELLQVFQESINLEIRKSILDYFGKTEFTEAESSVRTILLEGAEAEDAVNLELIVSLIGYLNVIKADGTGELLVPYLDSENNAVVASAVKALGTVGGEAEGSELLDRLRDVTYNDAIKPDIIVALGEMAYTDAVEELLSIVENTEQPRLRRMYAAVSLGQIGEERVIPALRNLFQETDSLLKMYAATALSYFSMSAVQDLLIQGLKDSNVKVRLASAKALANPAALEAVDILKYKAKYDPEKSLRLESIKTLAEIGNKESIVFLTELYQDSKTALGYREAAFNELCDRDLAGSLAVIESVIAEEWAKKDEKVLEFTAKKLSQMESKNLASLYRRFLVSGNLYVRIYGLRGIGLNHLSTFRPAVQKLADEDPHPAVRRVALAILESL